MYFEEPWFVLFCFRLNCSCFRPMTSSNILNDNVDEVEEGEIQDDDEPIVLVEELIEKKPALLPSPTFKKGFCYRPSKQSNYSLSVPFRPTVFQHTSSVSVESRGREPPNPNLGNRSRRRPNRIRQRRVRNRPRPSRILPRNPPYRRRRQNVKERSRAGTPYEEKLQDFKFRQERVRMKSKSEERKQTKTNVVGFVDTGNTGSSLLKRLVGAGSVNLKINGLLEQNKNISSSTTDIPKTDVILDSTLEKNENTTVTNPLLVREIPDCPNDTELKVSKNMFNSTETSYDSSLDPDDELIKLRMEALKTAVLKKHSERLKRGYVPRKISKNDNDSIVDSFIEEVESLVNLETLESSSNISSPPLLNKHSNDDILCDNSDMSMDSNYVSDDDSAGQNQETSPAVCDSKPEEDLVTHKRHHLGEDVEIERKRLKMKDPTDNYNNLNQTGVLSDLNDEELELRALALQSFLDRKALKDSDNETDVNSKLTNDKEILPVLKEEDLVKSTRVENDSENWEELDEDILRAQLLKTLSANLPIHDNKPDLPDRVTLKTVTPTFSKKEIDAELEIQSKRWSEMMVPELVIHLGSDSESEPENATEDFVKSLDLLLSEAKEKSEKMHSKIDSKHKVKKKNSPKLLKKPLLKKGSSGTPTAVKHLPIQQQEEYRRLKMKLAEKLKLNQNKSSPNVSPGTSRTQSPKRTQGHSISILQSKEETPKPNLGKKTLSPNVKIIKNLNSGSMKNNSVPIFGLSSKTENCINSVSANSPTVSNTKRAVNRVVTGVTKKEIITDFRKHILKSKVKMSMVVNNSKVLPGNSSFKSGTNKILSESSASVPMKKTGLKSANNANSEKINTFVGKESILPNLTKNPSSLIKKSVTSTEYKSLIKPENSADGEILQGNIKHNLALSTETSNPICIESECLQENQISKESECTSDKENEVKTNKEITINKKFEGEEKIEENNKRLPFIKCTISGESLLEKVKEAETKYEETLSLISRLEKELEEAKKTLNLTGRTVAELRELIKGPSDRPPSSPVKLNNENTNDQAEAKVTAPPTLPLPTERCWDPDGVLCPYQLAGSCKDSSCKFHHICS